MPERIQLRRTKGWRKPEGAIVVSRPSKWGNPYSVGWCSQLHRPGRHWHVYLNGDPIEIDPSTRTEAVEWAVVFFAWLLRAMPEFQQTVRAELRGRDLACWCTPDQRCHADVLLEIANGPIDGGTVR